MHNLDRTTAEFEFEDALQEFEYENDGEYEADQEYEYEYEDEYEDNEWEAEYESDEFESPFSEEEEMELAGELLDVNNEAELDQFLGKIFKKIGRRVKKIGRRLVPKVFRGLRKIAKTAVPMASSALGTAFGGPAGGFAGNLAGSQATKLFGLELEGMSYEDQEFEVAKRFVRMAGDTVKTAARLENRMPPDKAVNAAFKSAARKHAPGLLKPKGARRKGGGGRRPQVTDTGRWARYGNKIVLFGLRNT